MSERQREQFVSLSPTRIVSVSSARLCCSATLLIARKGLAANKSGDFFFSFSFFSFLFERERLRADGLGLNARALCKGVGSRPAGDSPLFGGAGPR